MASLKKREDSQYWTIRYRDPKTGKRTREATRYRWNNREETRAARELCAKRTYEEKQSRTSTHDDKWEVWVRGWLESHYHDSPQTLSRYSTAWRSIEALLIELGIEYPARLDHIAVLKFIDRRRESRRGKQKKNKKPIAPGTISTDVKVLRLVMDEAIRRKFATVNPCLRLGLSRKPLREIYEIKVEEEKIIREHLATSPEDMNIQFEIAMAQGVRFSETRIDMQRDVDLNAKPYPTVKIHGKGGKVYQTTLNPRLVPLFRALIARGDRYTWDLPPVKLLQCGRNWTRFFHRKAKLPHIWFHCTRGTAITRAHRSKVSFPKAMRFFNHASTLVHFIYTQLGIEDVSEVAEAVAAFSDSSGVPRYNLCIGSSDAPSARPERPESASCPRKRKRTPPPS
ncbi:MAG: hypothetical protein QOI07_885 [Verrucomicrobiota bacterium]|jgi:hypothetical protein